MIRKFLLAFALAAMGLFAAVPAASAVATPTPTVALPYATVFITTNITIVNVGGVVVIGGGGFLAGETINITVIYNGPSGLRSNAALRAAAAAGEFVGSTTADAQGNFSSNVLLRTTETGTATITATGVTSGRVVSTLITIIGQGETTPPGTTTAGSTVYVSYSTEPAAPGDGGSTDGSGLASTGASIAGPLTVGASALLAGLALLFFGTRLAIRRRRTAHH